MFVIISFNKIMIGHKPLAINVVHAGVRVTQGRITWQLRAHSKFYLLIVDFCTRSQFHYSAFPLTAELVYFGDAEANRA